MTCGHCGAGIETDEAVCLRRGWRPPTPAPGKRIAQPGELLFEFMRGHDRIRCELRDHGEAYGVEAQILHNEEQGVVIRIRAGFPNEIA